MQVTVGYLREITITRFSYLKVSFDKVSRFRGFYCSVIVVIELLMNGSDGLQSDLVVHGSPQLLILPLQLGGDYKVRKEDYERGEGMGTHGDKLGERLGSPDTASDSALEIWANAIVKKAARINWNLALSPGSMVRLCLLFSIE